MHKKFFLLLAILGASLHIRGAETPDSLNRGDAPRVYIDCRSCDQTYVRSEMQYVNYVIDRQDADVFILVTRERTGSGGRAYTLSLQGYRRFRGMTDTLRFTTAQEISEDDEREVVQSWLERGMVRYLNRTTLGDRVQVHLQAEQTPQEPVDRWNNWVIRTSINGWFSGESNYQDVNFHGRLEASRVTDAWKLRFNLNASYNEDRYIIDDREYVSITRNPGFHTLVVKSLSDHLSLGFRSGIYSSTYSNIAREFWVNPTIEYNIFPYQETTHHDFRFRYQVGYVTSKYEEITLYDQLSEKLLKEAFTIEFETRQHWGSAEIEVQASHYFHDLSKNRAELMAELDLKLFRGFSFRIDGRYALVHDQLALPKGEATQEDILLHVQELATQYNYWGSMGISYTFGSIYNNIVNTRF